jgi:hypothetical protein
LVLVLVGVVLVGVVYEEGLDGWGVVGVWPWLEVLVLWNEEEEGGGGGGEDDGDVVVVESMALEGGELVEEKECSMSRGEMSLTAEEGRQRQSRHSCSMAQAIV